MNITTRFDPIDQWLEACHCRENIEHRKCFESKIPGYPSRLLDIKGFEASGTIRLVDTKDLPKPRLEYTTLSHCWGPPGGPSIPKTTRKGDKLESYKNGIPIQELPKTFRDAVRITHRIGKAFLWIDSLTIIQDDDEDWKTGRLKPRKWQQFTGTRF